MPRERARQPTEAELEILKVLWQRGPSTVREVQQALPAGDRQPGYTTVLKTLQIMFDKGLVERDEQNRAHVYSAVPSAELTESQIVGDLVDRLFRGSTSRLVLRALASRPASADELAEIRRLLDAANEEER